MNQTLNKTFGQQSGNAKTHLDTTQALCKQSIALHVVFHEDLLKFLSQVSILKQRVKNNSQQLRKFFIQKLTPAQDLLVLWHQSQQQQNKNMQQTMTQIKRQNRQTQQAIAKTFQKLKILDKKIGQYH